MMPVQNSKKRVVGIAEWAVSSDPDEELVTYALGSCLGITVWDPVAGVGGMLHAMLPSATVTPDQGRSEPARYVDSGLTRLFREMYARGAEKRRIVLKVAGGANGLNNGRTDSFQVGRRNVVTLKKLLWKNGVMIQGEDVGGTVSRTMTLNVGSGSVEIRSGGETREL